MVMHDAERNLRQTVTGLNLAVLNQQFRQDAR
jgi:hypothetical protein